MELNCSPLVTPLVVLLFILLSVLVFYNGPYHQTLETVYEAAPTVSSSVPNGELSRTNVSGKKLKVTWPIEDSLQQARVAIGRAARRRSYSSNSTAGFVPKGDIYLDPYAFHQSYLQMEKRFKIWSYREGMWPLVHQGPHKGPYAVEGQLMSEIDGPLGRFAAKRPEDAHVFYLPLSVTNVITLVYGPVIERSYEPLRLVWNDYVNTIAAKHRFWNRSDGADHFMAACNDWGPGATNGNPKLWKNVMRLLCNANSSEDFVPSRDASFAEAGLYDGKATPPKPSLPLSQRTLLAFFSGGVHGSFRKAVIDQWKGKDPDVVVYEYLPKHINYDEMMRKARFCLCPSGYEVGTARPVQAIYAGCVPVIIAEGYVLPYSDVLDWSKFSVFVPMEKIPEIKNILQAITPKQYARLHKRVLKVQRHFVVNRPAKRFDLIHMSLHSVWLRRLNVRLPY